MKILRPIVYEDLPFLNKWRNDPDIFKYLGGGYRPTSIDEQEQWMKSFVSQTGNSRRFMIHPQEIQEPIGMVGLYSINWVHRTAEIGIFIGNKDYQGKGLAKKAYKELESYAANFLNLRKLKLYAVEDNENAVKFFLNLEYKIVGKLNQERYIEGKYCNLLIFEKFFETNVGR